MTEVGVLYEFRARQRQLTFRHLFARGNETITMPFQLKEIALQFVH